MSQCFGWCLKASFNTQKKSECFAEGVRIQRRVIFQNWLIKISFAEVAARLIDGTFARLRRFWRGGSVKILNFEILSLGAGIKKLSRRGTSLWWKFIGEILPKSDHKTLFHIF